MEVEDCREPLREGGRLMGLNQGTAEVRWNRRGVFFVPPHLSVYPVTARFKQPGKTQRTDSGSHIVFHSAPLLSFEHFSLVLQCFTVGAKSFSANGSLS